MSCGSSTRSGSWYYAASRQRYGCGSHLRVEANGRCAIVQTDDYGPDVCVERAAGGPILDASPLLARHLFGAESLGWSDRRRVLVIEVSPDTPLGPCEVRAKAEPPADSAPPAPSPDPGTNAQCTTDADCFQGICSGGQCVNGCYVDDDCPDAMVCVDMQCQ
jgi:hypothetical protein